MTSIQLGPNKAHFSAN